MIKFDPANFPAETEVRLALAPVLRGRVTANGVPLGGANIESKRALQANSDLTFNGFPCVMAPHTQVQATAAADGSFSLMLQAEKSVYLRCSAPGFAASIFGPIQVDSAPALIEIELNVGGAIEGHVRAEDGTTVVDAIVGVTCGDGHPRTMRSGHDGVFRFEGLTTTRPWLVLEREAEFRTDVTSTSSSDKEAHIDWSCEVTVGRTTYHDLQLNH